MIDSIFQRISGNIELRLSDITTRALYLTLLDQGISTCERREGDFSHSGDEGFHLEIGFLSEAVWHKEDSVADDGGCCEVLMGEFGMASLDWQLTFSEPGSDFLVLNLKRG